MSNIQILSSDFPPANEFFKNIYINIYIKYMYIKHRHLKTHSPNKIVTFF